MFGALVIAPLVIVYLFSLDFINRGIDSWFRVEIKQGLNDARGAVARGAGSAAARAGAPHREPGALAARRCRVRRCCRGSTRSGAPPRRRRSSSTTPTAAPRRSAAPRPMAQQPAPPPPEVALQLAAGRSYVSLNPLANGRYTIDDRRADRRCASRRVPPRRYVLINYEVPQELSALAEAVQHTSSQYGDLSAVREPLKISFRLTLTLVVLLTLLAAIYGAIFSAQRLTRPVQDLIAGTRAVGKGDFGTRLPLPSRDEMGFLVHSFNDMTKRLRRASEEADAQPPGGRARARATVDHPVAPVDRRHRHRPRADAAQRQSVGRHHPRRATSSGAGRPTPAWRQLAGRQPAPCDLRRRAARAPAAAGWRRVARAAARCRREPASACCCGPARRCRTSASAAAS